MEPEQPKESPIKGKEYKKNVSELVDRLSRQVIPEEENYSLLEEDWLVERQKVEVASLKQDLQERKKYAFWIFLMVAFWLLLILLIIFLVGFDIMKRLSDAVILALIGATTVNVTTFFLIVTKYLFPSGKDV